MVQNETVQYETQLLFPVIGMLLYRTQQEPDTSVFPSPRAAEQIQNHAPSATL